MIPVPDGQTIPVRNANAGVVLNQKQYLGLLNGAFIADASPKVQLVVGGGLMTAPGWAYLATLAQGITMLASMVAAVCGAIIGVHAVAKIFRRP